MKNYSKIFICILIILLIQTNLLLSLNSDGFFKKYGINYIGYNYNSNWIRFPSPESIPYLLPLYKDMVKNPYNIYEFSELVRVITSTYANYDYYLKNKNSIYKLFFYLSIDKTIKGFRGYNLPAYDLSKYSQPLLEGIKRIYKAKNRNFEFYSMDKIADYPRLDMDILKKSKRMNIEVKRLIGELLFYIADAYKWYELGLKDVDLRDLEKVFEIKDFVDTQFDAMEYYDFVDRIMKNIDIHSYYYSFIRILSGIDLVSNKLHELRKKKSINWRVQNFDFNTPLGKIIIRGSDDDLIQVSNALLVIDLGGNDRYKGNPGGNNGLNYPFGILIDLQGNDKYNETLERESMGSGVCGLGVLVDMKGNDNYRADNRAQGCGIFGVGILADLDGSDSYILKSMGQGAGFFGTGMLIDYNGRDLYRIYSNGQGMGASNGIGILIDSNGKDYYYAEPDAKITGRGDYHSDKRISYSYAQGCGVGRRGDISDGHSWAGGLGMLVDLGGDDNYRSGNWATSSSYWFGIGILLDYSGNDIYRTNTFSLCSGAHFSINSLIDYSGNDRYISEKDSKLNLCFSHDFTISFFADLSGNDYYLLRDMGLAYSISMGQSFFFDLKGDDKYNVYNLNVLGKLREEKPPFGLSDFYKNFSHQISFFFDGNGKDSYKIFKRNKLINLKDFKNNIELKNNFIEWLEGSLKGIFVDTDIDLKNLFKKVKISGTN